MQTRARGVNVGDGNLVFKMNINQANKRELNKVEDLAMTNGHEAFIHFERFLDELVDAYNSGNAEKVNQILNERRKTARKNSPANHEDHKNYINDNPDYYRMKIYQSQLMQVLNPKEVRKAIIEHDNKFKHLKK